MVEGLQEGKKEIFIRYDVINGAEEYKIDGREAEREEVIGLLKSGDVGKLVLQYTSVGFDEKKIFWFGGDVVRVTYERYPGYEREEPPAEIKEYSISKDVASRIIDILENFLTTKDEGRRLYRLFTEFGTLIRPKLEIILG